MDMKIVKVLGLVASAVGLGATLVSNWTKDRETEAMIDARIDQKLAEMNNEENEEEES